MASHCEIADEEYIKELKDKVKKKHEEKDWVMVQEGFQKVDKWKKNFLANLEEYKSNVLDQTPSQIYTFWNAVVLASQLLNSKFPMAPRKIKDSYHLCFQKFLK